LAFFHKDARTKEITESVKKMFVCARAQACEKQSITEDEFIAGYANVLYPQNLSVIQLDNHLKKLFGDHCLENFRDTIDIRIRNNNASV